MQTTSAFTPNKLRVLFRPITAAICTEEDQTTNVPGLF